MFKKKFRIIRINDKFYPQKKHRSTLFMRSDYEEPVTDNMSLAVWFPNLRQARDYIEKIEKKDDIEVFIY